MLGSVEDVDEIARAELAAQEEQAAAGYQPVLLPWDGGAHGGDARLRLLVPLLLGSEGALAGQPKSASWATLATHLPGRSGRECRERWAHLAAEPPAETDDTTSEGATPTAAEADKEILYV